MKKILLIAAMVVASMSVNAQWFVGGMAGFATNKYDGGVLGKETTTAFGINPMVGYSVNERFDVGIQGGYNWMEYKEADLDGGSWNVGAFAQWSAIQFSAFEVMLRGDVRFGGGEAVDITNTDANNNNAWDPQLGAKMNTIGVSIVPVIAYNISERFQILAQLNCAGLMFDYTKNKDTDEKNTFFGLVGDTKSLLNTSDFQLGFVVNF